MSQNNLKEIIKFRLEKIDFLKQNSIEPYAYKFIVKNLIKDIRTDKDKYVDKSVSIAGRVISLRKMGKTSFLNVQDMHGNIQVYIKNTNLDDSLYDNVVRKLDLGDIVGIYGKIFFTKTEELSIIMSFQDGSDIII